MFTWWPSEVKNLYRVVEVSTDIQVALFLVLAFVSLAAEVGKDVIKFFVDVLIAEL